jgi:hypothetical protein
MFAMAFLLNAVSPKESWPLLRACIEHEPDVASTAMVYQQHIPKAYCLLAKAGDKAPAFRYLEGLTRTTSLYPISKGNFFPLYYLEGGKAEKLVRELLCNNKSKFNLKYQLEAYGADQVGISLFTPLVKFEAFRKEYIRLMLSKETGGKVENELASSKPSTLYREAPITRRDLRWFEAETARKAKMRPGDGLALAVSQICGAPEFKMHWPAEQKDKAKKELATFLNNHWKAAYDVSTVRIERL